MQVRVRGLGIAIVEKMKGLGSHIVAKEGTPVKVMPNLIVAVMPDPNNPCCAKTRPKRDSRRAPPHCDVVGEPSALWNLHSRTTIQAPLGTDAHLRQASANGSAAASTRLLSPALLRLDQSTAAGRY